ncbi:pre-16S rRNA-processing nuclease YqgF [uncultured Phascolarctobacterium sp.]|uniref:pre-16S rRNA-processing nuclease YqgF n=1 Tax=uncultured Phascolarctobacterium sp. TaxID=512296 RepID=UPI002605C154|nr:pre-16S rRNA-processing nuclease YqgF [uncultured Phascolarctobacterium sp.]
MNKYLGIDPGRSKTGLALVAEDGSILALRIALTIDIADELRKFAEQKSITAIIMGNGTNSKAIGDAVQQAFPYTALHLVEEAHSTEEARELYWQEQPPKGWRKLIPLGLLVPPEPLDAYAAVVQARRWLAHKN